MLLFPFSEQGNWGLVTCYKSHNNNNNKVISGHTFFGFNSPHCASVFMELAIGYSIVWTQELEPEITNQCTEFPSQLENVLTHDMVSSALKWQQVQGGWRMSGRNGEAFRGAWEEITLFGIHFSHFHRIYDSKVSWKWYSEDYQMSCVTMPG